MSSTEIAQMVPRCPSYDTAVRAVDKKSFKITFCLFVCLFVLFIYMYVLKLGKMLQNWSSAAVVIGAFRVKAIKVVTEGCTNLPREAIAGGSNCLSKGGGVRSSIAEGTFSHL